MSNTIVPAAPGFYALFLSHEALKIPRQFFRHGIVAWQIHGDDHTTAWPVCITENGGDFDYVACPDGSFVHVTGFVCDKEEDALAFALEHEATYQRNLKSMAQA